MSMTDTIADMLTRIRNAQKSKLVNMVVPFSKLKVAILDSLKEEGYIFDYKVSNDTTFANIDIALKYSSQGQPAIQEIKRVSTPGKRVYSSISTLPGHYNGMGVYILSTPRGVMSDRKARQLCVGGEVICKIF